MSKYADRLRDQFHKEKGNFGRWLLAAILVGIFYCLVFLPYLSVLSSLADLESRQAETDLKIETNEKEIMSRTDAITRVTEEIGDASEFTSLYDEADSWINDIEEVEQSYDSQSRLLSRLRESLDTSSQQQWQLGNDPSNSTIRELQQTQPELMASYSASSACFFKLESEWIICHVESKRKVINGRLSDILYNRTTSHEITAPLKEAIDSNAKKYHGSLSGALASSSLANWFRSYLDDEQVIIRRWFEDIAEQRSSLMSQSNMHRKDQVENANVKQELDKRKQEFSQAGEIKTPIGTIKLGFHDLVSLFPFLALCIVLVLINSTIKQIVLRSTFKKNGPPDETTAEALALTMPIWLEPKNPHWLNILLLCVPALFAFTALYGFWKISHNRGLEITTITLNYNFILAITLFSAAIFAIRFIKIIKYIWKPL